MDTVGLPAVGARPDAAVFAELYPGLRRFAGVIGPELDPDDLVQEALMRTMRLHPLASLEHPGAYLRRALVRLVANERRTLRRSQRALGHVARAAADVPSYPSDLTDLLRLAPADRALLYLRAAEQMSYAEAAAIVGCSEEAARARASRAMRRLRLQLEEEDRA